MGDVFVHYKDVAFFIVVIAAILVLSPRVREWLEFFQFTPSKKGEMDHELAKRRHENVLKAENQKEELSIMEHTHALNAPNIQ